MQELQASKEALESQVSTLQSELTGGSLTQSAEERRKEALESQVSQSELAVTERFFDARSLRRAPRCRSSRRRRRRWSLR